jgi:hypothetical protein
LTREIPDSLTAFLLKMNEFSKLFSVGRGRMGVLVRERNVELN